MRTSPIGCLVCLIGIIIIAVNELMFIHSNGCSVNSSIISMFVIIPIGIILVVLDPTVVMEECQIKEYEERRARLKKIRAMRKKLNRMNLK